MFTLLLFIVLYGKLALSNSYLEQFIKVAETTIEDLNSGYLYHVRQPTTAIYIKDIFDAYDEETMKSDIPKQVCAEECFNAPYFCNSFLLGIENRKPKCFHYAVRAASIPLEKDAISDQNFDRFVWLDSLHEIKEKPDFVNTVAELSNSFISGRGRLSIDDWKNIAKNYYTRPWSGDYVNVENFGSYCEEAILSVRNIDSIIEKQTLRLGSLDQKSFITTLKKFHSSNPEYSPDFDKIALIFLKWFGPEDCNFSDSHYFAIDPKTQNRVFVHSFSSSYYVTVTREMDGNDHVTYISANGSFGQKDKNIHAAISKYLQSTDSLLGLAEGTTELSPNVVYNDNVDLSHFGSTKAEAVQQTALRVVRGLVTALKNDISYEDRPLNLSLLRDLITFVLSWAYKIRQSDFNMAGEGEILNRASKIRTMFTGFSPDSVVDVITQH